MESISTVTDTIKDEQESALLPKKLSEGISAMGRSDLKTNWEQLAENISLYELQSALKSALFLWMHLCKGLAGGVFLH